MPRWMLVIGLIAIFGAAGLWWFGQASPTGAVVARPLDKIRIGYLPIAAELPVFVGLEGGYFTQQGLEAVPVRFESTNQMLDALAAGKIDVAASPATFTTYLMEEKSPGLLKVFGFNVLDTRLPDQYISELLVRANDTKINSIADLRGRRVGIFTGAHSRAVVKQILKANGLSEGDVKLQELEAKLQLPALTSGQVDALFALEPTGTIGAGQNATRIVVYEPYARFVVDPNPAGAWAIRARLLEEEPQKARRVLAAFQSAFDATNGDWRSLRALLAGHLGFAPEVASRVPINPMWWSDGMSAQDVDSLQRLLDVYWHDGLYRWRPNATALLVH